MIQLYNFTFTLNIKLYLNFTNYMTREYREREREGGRNPLVVRFRMKYLYFPYTTSVNKSRLLYQYVSVLCLAKRNPAGIEGLK